MEFVDFNCTILYYFDTETSLFTFTLLENGGPVIITKDLDEGKKKMEEALNFSSAIRNLMYFEDVSSQKKMLGKKPRISNPQFVELECA